MKKIIIVVLVALFSWSCSTNKEEGKILVYTKNGKGFIHDNIEASVEMLKQISDEAGLTCVVSDNPSIFLEDDLESFDAIIFSNTNNEAFDNDSQRNAFQAYIRSGGAFVGIHSACGSEREWPWFWDMLGGSFLRHPPYQKFTVKVIDNQHPSTSFLGEEWEWEDEAYYLKNLNPSIHVLLAHDLSTIEDKGKEVYPGEIFGNLFPGAWCHEFEGGRSWYTSYGHNIKHYSDENFRQHVKGGILWAINKTTYQ